MDFFNFSKCIFASYGKFYISKDCVFCALSNDITIIDVGVLWKIMGQIFFCHEYSVIATMGFQGQGQGQNQGQGQVKIHCL